MGTLVRNTNCFVVYHLFFHSIYNNCRAGTECAKIVSSGNSRLTVEILPIRHTCTTLILCSRSISLRISITFTLCHFVLTCICMIYIRSLHYGTCTVKTLIRTLWFPKKSFGSATISHYLNTLL